VDRKDTPDEDRRRNGPHTEELRERLREIQREWERIHGDFVNKAGRGDAKHDESRKQ